MSSSQAGILSSSAVMAAGTVVSRLSGFVRSSLLAAALGTQLHADQFNVANTVPNMLYILLAGGIFNAVLVPQLVRAMKHDADSGEAYTNRIITLAGVFLLTVTVLLVLAAPLLMDLLAPKYTEPDLGAQRESLVDFARFCLPQVFFYGMFVLVGQILNARGTFGPMMWAPIANNVIAVGVLVVYLLVFGPVGKAALDSSYTSGQELLLGLGSTLGIAVQFLILLPYLRAAGFTYRPRFDFRGTGLGQTFRLGAWTVGFVMVNQIAYTVVVRLSTTGGEAGSGYTIYAYAFLITMVPHSIVTVSLATAVLPRLSASAAEGDLTGLADTLGATLRSTLALVVPFVLLLPVIALDLSHTVWGFGAASDDYVKFAPALALFAPGLLFFTVHYLMLRGFYALERTHTVFWIQCGVAGTNIALAFLFTALAPVERTAPALVLAYAGSYVVGSLTSYLILQRLLGGLASRTLARFATRMLVAGALAAAAAYGVWLGLHALDPEPTWPGAVLYVITVAAVDGVVLLVLARALRIAELTAVLELVSRRLPGSRAR